jgi:hypothetical protein
VRIWFCLAVSLALIGAAQAERPQRLSDRPTPTVNLVPAPGWRLSAVVTIDVRNGIDSLIIEGDVFNAGDSERPSPKVRLAVRDSAGREIFYWTILTDLERIKPGDYAPFRTHTESPPLDVENVLVSIVESTP